MLTYAKRMNAFTREEHVWRLEPDAIVERRPDGSERRMPFVEVERIRLAFAPTQYKPWRYTASLKSRSGERIEIDNAHFEGVGQFEDRSATYTPFIRALVSEVATAAPAAKGSVGAAPAGYWITAVALTLLGAFVALLLFSIPSEDMPGIIVLKLGLVAVYVPTLFVWFRRAFPRPASLVELPERALPQATG